MEGQPPSREVVGCVGTRIAPATIHRGHDHMGFTMACGSSRMVADLIGRKPELPLEGMKLTSRP